jgi:hypothetical protein
MMPAMLRPTVTQQVRAFLCSQGVAPRPWSGLDEVYAELYRLLRRRRDDAALWEPLASLLRGIIDSALEPDAETRLPAPEAELLASWDIEDLVRDLRRAIPNEEASSDDGAVARFAAGLGAAAMGGFLVLGMAAAGCAHEPPAPATPGEPATVVASGTATPLGALVEAVGTGATPDAAAAPPVERPAEAAPPPEPVAPPPPAPEAEAEQPFCPQIAERSEVLRRTLEASSYSADHKELLCGCLASLNESWVGGLTRLFEQGTPAEIARTLSLVSQCCVSNPGALRSDFAGANRRFRNGSLCREDRHLMVPVYRGVSFPGVPERRS